MSKRRNFVTLKRDGMRILHTSDWHIGQNLYGYDRHDEHAYMLQRIIDIAASTKPDAVLMSGDLFDTPQPSSAARRLLADSLLDLRRRCPDTRVIVTAGNHDSASGHEVNRSLWSIAGIDMIGKAEEGTHNIIEIPGKGYIIAVPYVNSRFMPEGYFDSLLAAVGESNSARLPVVLSAHIAVAGCDSTGHDTDSEGRTIGNIECVTADRLGAGYDYLALGHIHRFQPVKTAAGAGRYSGSPLAAGFDEAYSHGVVVVDIDSHGAVPEIEFVAVGELRPLVTIPATGALPWEDALSALKDFPDDSEAYLRLCVSGHDNLPADCRDIALKVCGDKKARFCLINLVRKASGTEHSQLDMTVEELRHASPADIARLYAEASGITFDDDMAAMLSEVTSALENTDRNK